MDSACPPGLSAGEFPLPCLFSLSAWVNTNRMQCHYNLVMLDNFAPITSGAVTQSVVDPEIMARPVAGTKASSGCSSAKLDKSVVVMDAVPTIGYVRMGFVWRLE